MQAATVKQLARECGFELAGIAPAEPIPADFARYESWVAAEMAGKMGYLTDRRAELRRDPRNLLAGARSVICVGKLYNQLSPEIDTGDAVIARYAWTRDYHDVLRKSLEELAQRIGAQEAHEWKACVDTAPLLERSYARQAGLGWIGRNQCLINEPLGSWFFLGELLTSLEIAPDSPPADRCGTCTCCIEACPTQAIVPSEHRSKQWTLDARRCIAYLNIELRGSIPDEHRRSMGTNIFGCDICQDVCPWNSRAPETADAALQPAFDPAPPLDSLAYLTEDEFRARYRNTPVTRPRYDGFLRNVAVAMGASGEERFREPLEHLSRSANPIVAEHARWALNRINVEQPSTERMSECIAT
ncbi:MAG TPA: tRNA epoxyqueuosine(34) reductase QueG [Bryobacteraceae bacterium]|nr:tRNA epoxyqueuosine(34) reductase QueG [Bryobacteraceae bacterium]